MVIVLNDPWPHENSFGASLRLTKAEHEKEEIAKTGRGFGGDIKDEITYHHQATAKQKTFIRDNIVYIPEFLQNCRFVAEKSHIKELRVLSEERQWRGLGLWILAAKGKHLGIDLPMDLDKKEEIRYWNGVLDSTKYFVDCEKEALKETFEERSLVLRTK
ncbi:hypothetical protein EAE99_003034 [Botrytis elliptica]|nr:hypothetical protein EAE99_003034 [Botrytis elliptica]